MKRTLVSSAIILSALALSGIAYAQEHSTGAAPMKSAQNDSMSAGDITDVAMSDPRFSTLCTALKAAGWVEPLKGKGPFTVFAPTNDAFAKLPAGTLDAWLKPENKARLAAILQYHVLNGAVWAKDVHTMPAATVLGQRVAVVAKDGSVMIDRAKVTQTDIKASNGVIHAIDTVLMPADKDIIETAMDAGSFTTLAKLLQAAGWVEPLKGKGPFTVFAPTDAAFAKLPAGTVEEWMKPENKERLAAVLKFHVLPAAVYSEQAAAMTQSIKTLQGTTFNIKAKDGVWIGNDKAMAKVTNADIQATNGVIHVIDTVLMPK